MVICPTPGSTFLHLGMRPSKVKKYRRIASKEQKGAEVDLHNAQQNFKIS